jgi:hypothetical protein
MKYDPKPSKGACGDAYTIRTKLTDVGTIKKPAGAPPPSSKGSISRPKQVGK